MSGGIGQPNTEFVGLLKTLGILLFVLLGILVRKTRYTKERMPNTGVFAFIYAIIAAPIIIISILILIGIGMILAGLFHGDIFGQIMEIFVLSIIFILNGLVGYYLYKNNKRK